MPRYFNSRPREGANRPRPARGRGEPISIPAPARGRTWQPLRACLTVIDFNSRPREGANLGAFTLLLPLSRFQFPPPRGGELSTAVFGERQKHFNSRPREGANPENPGGKRGSLLLYFNSRPREGANYHPFLSRWPGLYFNSRPREGANSSKYTERLQIGLFQFPPPRGGEPPGKIRKPPQMPISIPAPARGRTGYSSKKQGLQNFNSRPREGANTTKSPPRK